MLSLDEEEGEGGIVQIRGDLLIPYREKLFTPYSGRRLDALVESIKAFGILEPLIVWPHPWIKAAFEILAGQNRHNGGTIAGLQTFPCIVKLGLTEEEARLIVIESNIIQRSFVELCYSERVLVIGEHVKALKYSGKKKALLEELRALNKDYGRVEHAAGMEFGLGAREIGRYLRLQSLVPDLLKMLDEDVFAFNTAYNLSFLNEGAQKDLRRIISDGKIKLKFEQSEKLKVLSQEKGTISEEEIMNVLGGKKTAQQATTFSLGWKLHEKYFKGITDTKYIKNEIEEALDFYYSHKDD